MSYNHGVAKSTTLWIEETWWAIVHGVTKEMGIPEQLNISRAEKWFYLINFYFKKVKNSVS